MNHGFTTNKTKTWLLLLKPLP